MLITVVNTGRRDVVVSAPQLVVDGNRKQRLSFIDLPGLQDFPKRLSEGDTAALSIECAALAQSFGHSQTNRFYATCKDSAGREYRSKPWKNFETAKWLADG